MATAPPRVAAVVVHYGDPAPTARCLDSLAGIDEVILVDQPPTRFGSHPRITTRIEPRENIGFAAACNRAVERTDAEFVLLLNNDAVLEPDAAATLLAALPALPDDAAGACLKLLFPDGATLQSATGLWFTADGIGFPRGFGEPDRGQYDDTPDEDIGVPSGAAAIFRTACWREAGGMPEDFFCYCEDGDLGLRLVAAGYRFAWLPHVRVRHELSSSSGAHSLRKAYFVERNHFAVMIHHAPASALAALPLVTARRLARTAIDAVRGRGGPALLAKDASIGALGVVLLRAWLAAMASVPRAWRRRRVDRAHDAVRSRRVASFLARHRTTLDEFLMPRSRE